MSESTIPPPFVDCCWHPTAKFGALRARTRLIRKTREFLDSRGYLEVDVPVIGRFGLHHAGSRPMELQPTELGISGYLQTSPESSLKRLIAAGYGRVYSISRAFRRDPPGLVHNLEFSLLEWYRPYGSFDDIVSETCDFLQAIGGLRDFQRITFANLCAEITGEHDVLILDAEGLCDLLQKHSRENRQVTSMSTRRMWERVLDELVVPALARLGNVVLTDYPQPLACFSALSTSGGTPTALRFEIFANGIELANGCQELTDPAEYESRMRQEWLEEGSELEEALFVDRYLLGAVDEGLPKCVGVGIGIDRLVMLVTGSERISDVIAFPDGRA